MIVLKQAGILKDIRWCERKEKMVVKNNCKCRYCGENINYFFVILQNKVETWVTDNNQRRAIADSYNNGYKVSVRCPKPLCNKLNCFEYDANGNFIKEL